MNERCLRRRRRKLWALLAVAVGAGACAAGRPLGPDRSLAVDALSTAGVVIVMEPIVAAPASPGNVGRDFAAVKASLASRILSIVHERFPASALGDGRRPAQLFRPADYQAATGERVITAEERMAASLAYERGATHLLVTMITEWTEMRADDPLGALFLPHNSVTVTLRLMRLDPPARVGRATFHNRAHVTLNRPAIRLLDHRFRRTVLQLLSGTRRP